MKNIKKIIYDIMTTDTTILGIIWDKEQVYYQNDDAEVNRAEAKFDAEKSIITYYRISEKVHDYPKRVAIFQITCWDRDNTNAETLKNAVISTFNRRKNSEWLSYVSLADVGPEIYDSAFKAWGIPLTFIFIFRDIDY